MDVYVECMVAKEVTSRQRAMRVMWIVLCVLTAIAGIMYFILLPVFLLTVFLTVHFNSRMTALYEYTYMNGEMTFTRMTTNRRKRLFTCNMEQVEQVCPYREFHPQGKPYAANKDFASGSVSDALYAMIVNGEKGKIRVFFEPSGEMLDAMWRVSPRIVKKG